MIFTGIQALARHFGSRSSIVWACVLWSRSPNISVYLALFIVSSMPNHLVVPSADKCIHPHAVLNISLSVGMATFLLFTRFSLLSHQNRSFSSYSWKPWYSEWHLRKLQMGSHDVIPSISAEMVVLFHRFYHLCETTL